MTRAPGRQPGRATQHKQSSVILYIRSLELPSRRSALVRERVGKYPGDTMYYSINLALLSGSTGADPAFTRRGPKAKTHRAGHYRIIHSFIMHARLVADVAMHHPPSSSHPPSSVLCPPSPQVLVLPIDADCGYRPLKSLSTRVLKVNRRSAK